MDIIFWRGQAWMTAVHKKEFRNLMAERNGTSIPLLSVVFNKAIDTIITVNLQI